ncbi:hypothetical protein F3Y22_tig00110556pilonHSYRG00519 [Hibiscus syriacus]|uniref:Uncharacterized protein n=1 Tax=Hibiscus syriacus TaxID=106335 RepID=A0A6A3AAB8_HIBSY|nr:hypothetical protein F3Y22_tig00110556pilonHSYRG00519 [Hibiscus syriacus]
MQTMAVNEAAGIWKLPKSVMVLAWSTGNEFWFPAIAVTIPVDHIGITFKSVLSSSTFWTVQILHWFKGNPSGTISSSAFTIMQALFRNFNLSLGMVISTLFHDGNPNLESKMEVKPKEPPRDAAAEIALQDLFILVGQLIGTEWRGTRPNAASSDGLEKQGRDQGSHVTFCGGFAAVSKGLHGGGLACGITVVNHKIETP